MTEFRETLTQEAWKLLQEHGLDGLTPDLLSKKSCLSPVDVRQLCPSPLSIFLLLFSDVQEKVQPFLADNLSTHDILFEGIMNHLDALTIHKNAIQRFVQDLELSPCWLLDIKPYISEWSRQRLNQAHIETADLMGTVRIQVFTLFCLYILRIWAEDDTLDQSVTLAALDGGLRKLEEWQEMVPDFFRKG